MIRIPYGSAAHAASAIRRAPHIADMSDTQKQKTCPICSKPVEQMFRPFCSKRCADVDLHRWFSGVYAAPVTEDEEEDERREEGGEPTQ
jgi:endogenous inhibitor of DNA gyrase (YacG/DUF329 family)